MGHGGRSLRGVEASMRSVARPMDIPGWRHRSGRQSMRHSPC